jgi:chemotaxis protein methyltransferase WspC
VRHEADLRPFVRLLEERIGLDAASIGHDEIARAVRRRLEATGAGAAPDGDESGPAYYHRLLADSGEWDEFVELVLVPETWFFREPSAFDLLGRLAREAASAPARRRLRVLSLPCATGEEAYSIAMTLLDAGLDAGRATVDALDISRVALDAARRAIYAPRSTRHVGADRLSRHFVGTAGGHEVRDAAGRMVTFGRGNLMDPGVLAGRARYHVIFCRNVLIYLTQAARTRVLATLRQALAPDGYLIAGHAETMRLVAPHFVSARVPGTFAYRPAAEAATEEVRRGAPREPTPAPARTRPPRTFRGASPPARPLRASPPLATGPAVRSLEAKGKPGSPSLAEVERLADGGHLVAAEHMCRAYLESDPGSPQAYYLLGLVASGRRRAADAERAFRRAIYLDPDHVAALRQLALERRRAGDTIEADRLGRRADAAEERGRRGSKGAAAHGANTR